MLRLTLDRIPALIVNCQDEDRRVRLYTALYTSAQRLTTAMRTHALLVGRDQELLAPFWQAVGLFRHEHDL